jgi:hypothetical protein
MFLNNVLGSARLMRIMAKQVTNRVSIIKPPGSFSMGVVKKVVRDWTLGDHGNTQIP